MSEITPQLALTGVTAKPTLPSLCEGDSVSGRLARVV